MAAAAKQPAGPGPLAPVVADLYALLPSEFTAARNARAAEAVRNGNKELGKRIKALPKPSTAAWLVNLLAGRRQDDLAAVLELGAALREAQEDLDRKQLRRLSTERQRLLRAIIREARELAAQLDHPVSEGLAAEAEQTLWAAMTDAGAADAVASGQLVRSLSASGWEEVNLDGAVADPESVTGFAGSGRSAKSAAGTAPSGQGTKDDAGKDSAGVRRRRAAADRLVRKVQAELEAAEDGEKQAQGALDAAQREVEEAAGHRDELTDEIDDLRERIRELERDVTAADRLAGRLERERDAARRTARSARRAVERTRQKLADARDAAESQE